MKQLDKYSYENSNPIEEKAPTWEILAVVVGFVGTAKDVPDLLAVVLGIADPVSPEFKRWSQVGYLGFLFFMSSFALFRLPKFLRSEKKPEARRISDVDTDELVAALRRARWITFVRMFPLSLIREIAFRMYDVRIYDFFKRQSHWDNRPGYFDWVGRFNMGSETVEIQFPKDFSAISFRKTLPASDEFGPEQKLTVFHLPYRGLLLASYRSLLWAIGHLLFGLWPKMTWLFPIVLTVVGVGIHAAALLGSSVGDAPTWLHITMLFVDSLVVVGLLLRTKWGYGLALALYLQQLVFQTYWACEGFQSQWEMRWMQVLTVLLCALAFAMLALRRECFVSEKKHPPAIQNSP